MSGVVAASSAALPAHDIERFVTKTRNVVPSPLYTECKYGCPSQALLRAHRDISETRCTPSNFLFLLWSDTLHDMRTQKRPCHFTA